MTENTKLWFECTLGKKSHMNIAGKIVFFPLIVIVGGTWFLLDLLFSKQPNALLERRTDEEAKEKT